MKIKELVPASKFEGQSVDLSRPISHATEFARRMRAIQERYADLEPSRVINEEEFEGSEKIAVKDVRVGSLVLYRSKNAAKTTDVFYRVMEVISVGENTLELTPVYITPEEIQKNKKKALNYYRVGVNGSIYRKEFVRRFRGKMVPKPVKVVPVVTPVPSVATTGSMPGYYDEILRFTKAGYVVAKKNQTSLEDLASEVKELKEMVCFLVKELGYKS